MTTDFLQRLQVVLQHWDNLKATGQPDEIVEEVYEFLREQLPDNHPLRASSDRIGFQTKPEREAHKDWSTDKEETKLLLEFIRRVVFGTKEQLQVRLFLIGAALLADEQADFLKDLVSYSEMLNNSGK